MSFYLDACDQFSLNIIKFIYFATGLCVFIYVLVTTRMNYYM